MKAVPEAAAVRPLLVTPGPGHQVCQCVSALLGVSEILAVGDRMGNNCVPSPEGESAAKRSERTSDSDSLGHLFLLISSFVFVCKDIPPMCVFR